MTPLTDNNEPVLEIPRWRVPVVDSAAVLTRVGDAHIGDLQP